MLQYQISFKRLHFQSDSKTIGIVPSMWFLAVRRRLLLEIHEMSSMLYCISFINKSYKKLQLQKNNINPSKQRIQVFLFEFSVRPYFPLLLHYSPLCMWITIVFKLNFLFFYTERLSFCSFVQLRICLGLFLSSELRR